MPPPKARPRVLAQDLKAPAAAAAPFAATPATFSSWLKCVYGLDRRSIQQRGQLFVDTQHVTTVVDTKARPALEIWTHLAALVGGGGGRARVIRGLAMQAPGSVLPSPARLAVVLRGPGQLPANSRVNIATSCSASRAKRPHRSRCLAAAAELSLQIEV